MLWGGPGPQEGHVQAPWLTHQQRSLQQPDKQVEMLPDHSSPYLLNHPEPLSFPS